MSPNRRLYLMGYPCTLINRDKIRVWSPFLKLWARMIIDYFQEADIPLEFMVTNRDVECMSIGRKKRKRARNFLTWLLKHMPRLGSNLRQKKKQEHYCSVSQMFTQHLVWRRHCSIPEEKYLSCRSLSGGSLWETKKNLSGRTHILFPNTNSGSWESIWEYSSLKPISITNFLPNPKENIVKINSVSLLHLWSYTVSSCSFFPTLIAVPENQWNKTSRNISMLKPHNILLQNRICLT